MVFLLDEGSLVELTSPVIGKSSVFIGLARGGLGVDAFKPMGWMKHEHSLGPKASFCKHLSDSQHLFVVTILEPFERR